MALKLPQKAPPVPKSAEELFHTLRNRTGNVKNLWSHQADILRAYHKELDSSDVALELPTGSGKTLVALLIAEYRRRAKRERIAYLCPTRQLAQQVGAQAASYGIPVVVLVGRGADYNPKEFAGYATGDKIAITTYNGIFNTNPRINSAQCLLLDDAHAAESYLANHWSMSIDRLKHRDLYAAIRDIFADDLPEAFAHSLREDEPTADAKGDVAKVPLTAYWQRIGSLRDAIATAAAFEPEIGFRWSILREHLDGCNLYLSWGELLLRPFAPPSRTHAPFADANQRVYLSATLGEGGELERVTGVDSIVRLPSPEGWDRRCPGRRLILLPNLSLGQHASEVLAADLANSTPRTLILCPDRRRSGVIEATLTSRQVARPVLHADDIEHSLDPFTSQDAVLVLTNRYDGLDLPDDSCRLVVINGLPDAANLQERFLAQRLSAGAILRDRVRTRITQALGRCTRNDTDYAVVVLVGERLASTFAQSEFQRGLHPDLQIEAAVGITTSQDTNADDLLATAQDFLDDAIVRAQLEVHVGWERDDVSIEKDTVATVLSGTVKDELAYAYGAWNSEWRRAFEAANRVCDKLEGGRDIRPYQALWYYFASSAAARVSSIEGDPVMEKTSRVMLERAMASSHGTSWFRTLRPPSARVTGSSTADELDAIAVEAATKQLMRMGAVGTRFEKRIDEINRQLLSVDPKNSGPFENGVEAVGRFLGWQARRYPGEAAAPDGVWDLDRRLFLAIEAKSGADRDKPIPVRDVREAKGHADWLKGHEKPPPEAVILVVLTTHQTLLDKAARPFAPGVHYLAIGDLQEIASQVWTTLRGVRADSGKVGEDEMRVRLHAKMRDLRLLPSQLRARLVELGTLSAD